MLRRFAVRAASALLVLVLAGSAHGWGFEGHAIITRSACDLLPEPIRTFFVAYRDALATHSIDPDLWRRSGDLKHAGEASRHFLDIDYERFGSFPFDELPRDYGVAVEKFGDETFRRYGTLPWRIADYLDTVVEAMVSGDTDGIVRTAAAHAHYVQDAHMPLHAVVNYDGELTGQDGVHRRWESGMVERYADELERAIAPDLGHVVAIDDPLATAFEVMLDSYGAHFALLNADRRAAEGLDGELAKSDPYYDRLWTYSRRLCIERMSAAAVRTARYWWTAWDLAGRPELPVPAGAKAVRPRARDLGIVIGALPPGPLNAITDVAGVRVGHTTISNGHGAGAVRTGITAIVPRDDVWHRKVPAATFVFNGNGEMTGSAYVDEAGWLEVPILLTGTLNVPRVADGVIAWMMRTHPAMGVTDDVVLPLVAECSDAWLTDAPSRPITDEHVIDAIENSASGAVEEGGVGAGTGMISYSFKGGCGTASRIVGDYTVGVFVLANGGRRPQLRVDGVPVGEGITDRMPATETPEGSFIVVLATDAPLTSRQLERLCKRTTFGIARTGTIGRHGSGDFSIAFSTATVLEHSPEAMTATREYVPDSRLNGLFAASVEATEEAIINALVAGRTTTGRDGHTAYGLPHDRLRRVMSEHRRLNLGSVAD